MKQKYKDGPLTKFLTQKASKLRIPISGAFELTPLCNMDCKMCYVKLTKEQVEKIGKHRTTQEWVDLAQEAKEKGMLYLLLTGGEPFLYKDFKELYIKLYKMGFVISINSNGTLIDEEIIEWLKDYPPQRINITLYGGSNETYNRLCNNPKGFDQVSKAINLLKEVGINVKLNCTITPYNSDDLELVHKFAKDKDLVLQVATYLFPPIRKDATQLGQNKRYNPEKAAELYVKNDLLMYEKEMFIERAQKLQEGLIKINCSELNSECELAHGDKMMCKAGKSLFWITWDGRMVPCGMMNFPVRYPFEDGFDESWNEIVEDVENIYLPKECSLCKLRNMCANCAAMTVTETGKYDKKPEYICKMTECIIEQTKLKYEEMTIK